jgi:hypothetical protein
VYAALTEAEPGVLMKNVCGPGESGKPLASARVRFPFWAHDWAPPTGEPASPSGTAPFAIINSGGESSSSIVPVAVPSAIVAAVGFERVSVNVSLLS